MNKWYILIRMNFDQPKTYNIPVKEYGEIKQEQVLWQGTIALEFVIGKDKKTGKRKLYCIEMNGHNSQFLDYNDIKGIPKTDQILTEVRMHKDRPVYQKIKASNDIQDEMDIGEFMPGMSSENEKRIRDYLNTKVENMILSHNGNTNPLPITKIMDNKLEGGQFIKEEDKPREWRYIETLINDIDPPTYVILKPRDGRQGKNISIWTTEELRSSYERLIYLRAQVSPPKSDELSNYMFDVILEEYNDLVIFFANSRDYVVQEFIGGLASKNTPKELKGNKATLRYAIDFTVTKSGKIIPSFVRPYASVIEAKRKNKKIPEYNADVLNGNSKVQVFKLSPWEEAEAERITMETIKNLTDHFFVNKGKE